MFLENKINRTILQAIWNWLDTYPEEFTDLQKRPNAELSGNFYFYSMFKKENIEFFLVKKIIVKNYLNYLIHLANQIVAKFNMFGHFK